MGIQNGTLWEIRSGGSDLNGAGFWDRFPGVSVDYSQQDVAQVSFTNLTTLAMGGVTLRDGDLGGLFTFAMRGNIIYIASGTNFVAGYYEIISRLTIHSVTLDRSPTPGGIGANGAGKVGGGRQTITDAFLDGVVTDGGFVYLENGTYVQGAALNITLDGSPNLPITFEGYNATRGDDPTGANRPLIQDGGNALNWSGASYWVFKNLRFEVSLTSGFQTGIESVVRNCKSSQSLGGDNDYAFSFGQRNIIFDCEAENTNAGAGNQGRGMTLSAVDSKVIGCYIHDCKRGISTISSNQTIMFNIIDCGDESGGQGINLSGSDFHTIAFNTLHDCDTGVIATDSYSCLIFGNIINSCGTGLWWFLDPVENNLVDYNNYFGNDTDVTNVTKGKNATAVDPQFTNPGTDFSLQPSSLLREAVPVIRLGTY